MMKTLLAIVFMICCTMVGATEPPNFIIVYVDDLGWADTSVPMMLSDPESESDFNQTPYLEKLAAKGMTFSVPMLQLRLVLPLARVFSLGRRLGV